MLSDEDKQRIEAEEAYRAQTRAKLAADADSAELEQLEREATEKIKRATSDNKVSAWWLIFGVVMLIAIAAFSGGGLSNDSSASTPKSRAKSGEVITTKQGQQFDSTDAVVICKDQIKQRLKAPSTAKFPGGFSSDYTKPRRVGNTWRYQTVLDAQNGFGAMIRSSFLCIVDGDSGKINVEETP